MKASMVRDSQESEMIGGILSLMDAAVMARCLGDVKAYADALALVSEVKESAKTEALREVCRLAQRCLNEWQGYAETKLALAAGA